MTPPLVTRGHFVTAYRGQLGRRDEIEIGLQAHLAKVFAVQGRVVHRRLLAIRRQLAQTTVPLTASSFRVPTEAQLPVTMTVGSQLLNDMSDAMTAAIRHPVQPANPTVTHPVMRLRAEEVFMDGFDETLADELDDPLSADASEIGAALVGLGLFGTALALNSAARAHVDQTIAALSTTGRTALSEVQDVLASTYTAGDDYDTMIGDVDGLFDRLAGSRAALMAGIATTGLLAGMATIAARLAGLPTQRRWNSQHDDRVRDFPKDAFSHVDADGEVVSLDEPFTATGEDLDFPGDPKGSLANICGCRCYITLVRDEGDEPDVSDEEAGFATELRSFPATRGEIETRQSAHLTEWAGNAGNADALIKWYVDGADGAIDWGQPGDFEQCVQVAGEHVSDPEGFCAERHHDATGEWPGKNAHKAAAETEAFDFDPEKHPRDEKGRFDSGTGGTGSGEENSIPGIGSVDRYLAAHPRQPGEELFVWQARITKSLDPAARHELLFQAREKYPPVGYIQKAADDYRAAHGLPNPKVNPVDVPAPLAKAEIVARHFEGATDQSGDPNVQAAYKDFIRQNDEMFKLMTTPAAEGGMGVKVDFSPNKAGDPYPSAALQAQDLRDNHHITIQSGLGGDNPLISTEKYDQFRAVHDTFGHTQIGSGFDRHGEYEAWLEHMSMYREPGSKVMASEYHGVNTSLWAGAPGGTPTGRAVLLPDNLTKDPWDSKGNLVRAQATSTTFAAQSDDIVDAPTRQAVSYLVAKMDVPDTFAEQFDRLPWHYVQTTVAPRTLSQVLLHGTDVETFYREDQPRDDHGRWTGEGDSGHPVRDALLKGLVSVNNLIVPESRAPETTPKLHEPRPPEPGRHHRLRDAIMKGLRDYNGVIVPESRTAAAQDRAEFYNPDQPRDDHGRWDSTGGDSGPKASTSSGKGTKADPIKTNDPTVAAQALGEGKYVQLDQPRTVSTMLEKIRQMVDDAKAKGAKAPNYDLCRASVAGTNLFCAQSEHIPRIMMPQLKGVPTPGSKADGLPRDARGEVDLAPKFVEYLKGRGIGVTAETVPANVLRPSQNELNGAKVAGIAHALDSGVKMDGSIFATKDDYIVDGHHRWAAEVDRTYEHGKDVQMSVNRIDAPILKVLAIANNFTDSWGIPHAAVGQNLKAALAWILRLADEMST